MANELPLPLQSAEPTATFPVGAGSRPYGSSSPDYAPWPDYSPWDVDRQIWQTMFSLLRYRSTIQRLKFIPVFLARCYTDRSRIGDIVSHFQETGWSDLLALSFKPALRHLRPYLFLGLSRAQRVAALKFHYAQCAARLKPAARIDLYASRDSRIPLITQTTEAGVARINLRQSSEFYREGEWTLELCLNDRPLMILGLSLFDPALMPGQESAGNELAIWIGGLKAMVADGDVMEPIRDLTKAMDGMRPKQFLMLAAIALAKHLNAQHLYAVSNDGRVFAQKPGTRVFLKADYDCFWQECDGVAINPYAYSLPIDPAERDLSTYKANKRAAARRRKELHRQILDDLAVSYSTLFYPGEAMQPALADA